MKATLTAVWLAAGAVCAASDLPPWWRTEWRRRVVVLTVEPELAGKINTAKVVLDKGEPFHDAGRDVRVVDDRFRIVPYATQLLPDGRLAVEFCIAHESSDRYAVYYDNPDAQAMRHRWKKQVGGLFLETRDASPYRRYGGNVYSFKQMQKMLEMCKTVYGRKPWPCINDTHNPFGSDDRYLSIYTGDLFCPETGRYGFATNSDDASFLLIDGQLVAQWPGGHVPAQTWVNEESKPGYVRLKRGIHKITYYQVESYGGQLARAGWKKPSDEYFTVIPPRAFVRELPTWIIARQARDKPANAFFEFEQAGALRIGSDKFIFPAVKFQSRAASTLGKIVAYQWDFGDGTQSSEANPRHEYARPGRYAVKLTVWDSLGFSDTAVRQVEARADDVRNVVLFVDVHKSATILRPGEPLEVTVRLHSQIGPIPFELHSSLVDVAGRRLEDTAETVVLQPNVWRATQRSYQPGDLRQTIRIQIAYRRHVIQERAIDIMPTRSRVGALRVDNENLVSADGRIVVLKLDDLPLRRGDMGRRFRVEGRPLRIVVIDDSLSPAASGPAQSNTYYGMLGELIRKHGRAEEVEISRVGRYEQSAGYPPLVRLSRLDEDVIQKRPDVVLLVCSITDILNYLPEHEFEGYLRAALDQILSQTEADVFILTPPPLAVNPLISKPYAMAAKRVAQQRRTPTIDLYTLFFLREKELLSFYQDEADPDPVFYLEPNLKGQRLIAQEAYRVLYGGRSKYAAK